MNILNSLLLCLTILTSISYSQNIKTKESSQPFPVEQNGKWGYINKTDNAKVSSLSAESTPSAGNPAQAEAGKEQQSKNQNSTTLEAFLRGWQW